MRTFMPGTRFFVSGETVFACPPNKIGPETGNVLYSPNGTDFYVVLTMSGSSVSTSAGYESYTVFLEHPALELAGRLDYDSSTETIIWGEDVYALDESFDPSGATITELKPMMEVRELIRTNGGYLVEATNRVGRTDHLYFDGEPVTELPGSARARGNVETLLFNNHRLDIYGDHLDTARQTATFDGRPATILKPSDYIVTFSDDLSKVTVTEK